MTTTETPGTQTPGATTEQTETYAFLEGNFAPVREEVTITDLEVEGSLPTALDGRYLRTGPNPIAPDPGNHHWFIGDGMLHGVRLRGGTAEWYRNRWVRSPQIAEALGEEPPPITEGGVIGPGPGNTNIVHHAGSIWALTELCLPYEISPELDTKRNWNFGGELPAGINAHPKFDPDTGELHVMAYSFVEPFLRYHVIDATGQLVRSEELTLGGPVMVHDMALTGRYAVAFDLPVVFNLDAAMAGKALPYRWDPEYTPRIGLLRRDGHGADTQWLELDEACYVYHPLNAYDDGGQVVIDLVVHPRAFDDAVHGDPSQGQPSMQRWTVDPSAGTVKREVVDDRGQEFPRADERLATRKHRFGYSAAVTIEAMGRPDDGSTLLKYDMERGTVEEHRFAPGSVPSEFVFVPAHDGAGEDEGWLLGYVYDGATGTSALEVLDAHDVAAAPVARVKLPVRVPAGFHGNWIPDRALA
jgi:carotenoid cleavage oxygenase